MEDNLHNNIYQYLHILQMIGYFPYIPYHQIDTSLDERMITAEIWEWGKSQPTYITVPNLNKETTHLWN